MDVISNENFAVVSGCGCGGGRVLTNESATFREDPIS